MLVGILSAAACERTTKPFPNLVDAPTLYLSGPKARDTFNLPQNEEKRNLVSRA